MTTSASYYLADRVIASELPLPELQPAPSERPDWRLTVSSESAPSAPPPYHHWVTAAGERWASFAHDGERLRLHFARTAAFVVDELERSITCHPIGRTRADAIRPVILNQVVPLLFGAERLVMHASAVTTAGGALVFAGAPGMGKSTVAAALAMRGASLMTDDALIVDQQQDQPCAVASRVEPRLWPDSIRAIVGASARRFPRVGQRTLKRRISPPLAAGIHLAKDNAPIARIFVFSHAHAPGAVQRVTAAAAMTALTACTFVARVDDPAVARNTFIRVAALVSRVPVFHIGVVRDFDELDALCDALRQPA